MTQSYQPPQGAPGQAAPAQDPASAGPAHQPYPQNYYQYYPQAQAYPDGVSSWFAFSNASYIKGLLLGAGVTLLLTNPTVQKTMVRGAVKLWSGVQYGMEEVKEQIQDIKAELSLKADKDES